MISVILGTNLKKSTVIVDKNLTLRQVLEDNGIDYSSGFLTLDSVPLQVGDIDRTFASLGIDKKCYLLCVVKADNA